MITWSHNVIYLLYFGGLIGKGCDKNKFFKTCLKIGFNKIGIIKISNN